MSEQFSISKIMQAAKREHNEMLQEQSGPRERAQCEVMFLRRMNRRLAIALYECTKKLEESTKLIESIKSIEKTKWEKAFK